MQMKLQVEADLRLGGSPLAAVEVGGGGPGGGEEVNLHISY